MSLHTPRRGPAANYLTRLSRTRFTTPRALAVWVALGLLGLTMSLVDAVHWWAALHVLPSIWLLVALTLTAAGLILILRREGRKRHERHDYIEALILKHLLPAVVLVIALRLGVSFVAPPLEFFLSAGLLDGTVAFIFLREAVASGSRRQRPADPR